MSENTETKLQIRDIITCPHCGSQYHAAEIFHPTDYVGEPESIVRDPIGNILYVDYMKYREPENVQHFTCYNCSKPFIVEALVGFRVSEEDPALDFSSTTVSLFD